MKFEFTGEVKIVFGIQLKRIRALADIDLGWKIIKGGELGGWLEKETNLSQFGNAWVYGNAKVYGNAEVCGDAKVCGDAEVYGDAKVYGDMFVGTNKHMLLIGTIGSRNGFTTFGRNRKGEIKISCGCFFGTTDEFLQKVKQTHGDNEHSVRYKAAVEFAQCCVDTTPIEDYTV